MVTPSPNLFHFPLDKGPKLFNIRTRREARPVSPYFTAYVLSDVVKPSVMAALPSSQSH